MQKENTSPDKLWTPTFTALTGINFGVALPFYLTMVIMTDFSVSTYGVDYGIGALSVTVFVIAALITRLLFGKKIDDWGPKRMLTLGLALSLIACITYALPISFPVLLAMRIVQGIGFAIASGAAAAGAAMTLPLLKRAEGIGYFSMMQALATGIGPFVAVLLKNITGNYTVLFIFTAVVSTLALAAVAIVKLDIHTANKDADKTEEQVESKHGIHKFLHASVLLLTPSLFLVYLGYSGVVSFVVPYASDLGLEEAASIYFVLYAAAILLTRPPVGKHVDKHGERPLIFFTFGSIVVGLVALAFATNGIVLLISSVLLGFGIGATQSILQAVVARDTPYHELGLANSTFFMSMDLGAGVGPVLIGFFVPYLGFMGCYCALAIAAALACILYVLLAKRKRQ